HRASAVAEQHACRSVGVIHEARQCLGPNEQDVLVTAGGDHLAADDQAIDEAAAAGLEIEGAAFGADGVLNQTAGGGEQVVRGSRGADDQVDVAALESGLTQRLLGGSDTQTGGCLSRTSAVA